MVLLERQTCAGSGKGEVVGTLTKGFGGAAGTKAWPKHVPRAGGEDGRSESGGSTCAQPRHASGWRKEVRGWGWETFLSMRSDRLSV